MRLIETIRDSDVNSGKDDLNTKNWFKRSASRAVLLGNNKQIYLLKMSTYNYHKLPGGGIDEDETLEDALCRELLEEVGCTAKVLQEVGEIVEFRNNQQMEQHSFCYIAQQAGALVETSLEQSEIEEGAETVIVTNIDAAIRLLENDIPTNYEGHFIRKRDLRFLHEAKSLL